MNSSFGLLLRWTRFGKRFAELKPRWLKLTTMRESRQFHCAKSGANRMSVVWEDDCVISLTTINQSEKATWSMAWKSIRQSLNLSFQRSHCDQTLPKCLLLFEESYRYLRSALDARRKTSLLLIRSILNLYRTKRDTYLVEPNKNFSSWSIIGWFLG